MIDLYISVFDSLNRRSEHVMTLIYPIGPAPAGMDKRSVFGLWATDSTTLSRSRWGAYIIEEVNFNLSEEQRWIYGDRGHWGRIGFFFDTVDDREPAIMLDNFDPMKLSSGGSNGYGDGKLAPATGRYANFLRWNINPPAGD